MATDVSPAHYVHILQNSSGKYYSHLNRVKIASNVMSLVCEAHGTRQSMCKCKLCSKHVCCEITAHKYKEEHCWILGSANFRYCAGICSQRVGIHSSINRDSPSVKLQLNHLAQTPTLFMKDTCQIPQMNMATNCN